MTIFQTKEWEKFKLKTGYQKSWRVSDVLILEKKIPPLGSMLYSPMLDRRQQLTIRNPDFLAKIREIAKDVSAIFFRAEIDVPSDRSKPPTAAGFIKAFEEIQPEHTLVLNISKPEEEILREMKPKGRYNIKVAEKHGVRVIKGLPADATALQAGKIEDFYKLYETTARRQKITHRALSYFQNLVDILGKKGYVKVFMAKASQQSAVSSQQNDSANSQLQTANHVLASAVVVFYEERAIYLYGGSSEIQRNVMAPYKLHFEIIREAKKRGCKEYDFFGIAPSDDPNHPWAGVTRFKKQFGGYEVTILGSWDLIFSPTKYRIFKFAEKIRRH
ncbi:hypothetical protein AUJ40_01835 [Candidatus Berkelbacteria bacterium CG1_02_42_45]|uniref:Peptidoglycan bridge formation protein FemAB n=4 Tax=Candidatus Berkelbacteria TaxID=1618330 RepID=A0A2M7K1I8_9BACT|nr:MAG: hypothetical protein AUJ40_01835 [Candidatus Berkelbacteria bacterium CG1_02_42_45]PIX30119.1 MAG: hypothetical protein COZ63_01420 [Candidatus Berkelbacteria bacterium CG_4_8_14_3_um_filter_42_13]